MRKLLPNPKDRGHFPRLLQLLALFTLFFALPQTAWGDDGYFVINTTPAGGHWVSSNPLEGDYPVDDILGDGTMSYDVANNILTLNGINLALSGEYADAAFISCNDDDKPVPKVKLVGNNTLTLGDNYASFFDGSSLSFITDANNPGSLTINTPSGYPEAHLFVDISDPITPTYSNDLSLTKNGNTYTIQAPSTSYTSYGIIVAGTAVTSANASNVLNDHYSSVSYDATTNTLTLKGVHLNSTNNGISVSSDLNINLVGYSNVGTINVTSGTLNFTTSTTLPGCLITNITGNSTITYGDGTGLSWDGSMVKSSSTNPYIIYATGCKMDGDNYCISGGDFSVKDNKGGEAALDVSPDGTVANSLNNASIDYYKVSSNSKSCYIYPASLDDINLVTKAYLLFDWGTCTNKDVKVQIKGLDSNYANDGTYSEEVSLPADGGLVEIPLTGTVNSNYFQIYFSSSTGEFSFIPISVGFLKTEGYGLTVAGVEVTADNASNITGANIQGTVSYDVENHKLTLNGVTLTSPIHWGTDEDLTIELKGTNSMNTSGVCISSEYDTRNIIFTQGDTSNPCSLTLSSTGAAVAADVISGFGNSAAPTMGAGLYWFSTSSSSATVKTLLSGGEGTEESPLLIKNYNDLKDFATYVNDGTLTTEYVKLSANITGADDFTLIGTNDYPFIGTFDGDGNTISGITYTTDDNQANVGLFAYVGISGAKPTTGTVKNLELKNCSFTGGGDNGAIAGYVNKGTIDNCVVNSCTVTSGNPQSPNSGGIAGTVYNGTISNCVVSGSTAVSANTTYSDAPGTSNAGGVIGNIYTYTTNVVSGCAVEGSVTVNSSHADGTSSIAAGAIVGGYGTGNVSETPTFTNNTYASTVTTSTKAGTAEAVVKSGQTQRGIGNADDVIGQVELAGTKKVTVYVPDVIGNGGCSEVAGTYYKFVEPNYYVLSGSTFKYSMEPEDGYKPAFTLSDNTVVVTANEVKEDGVYVRTEFTFTMPNADLTATLSFPIDLAADGITATIDDLDYTGSAIEPTTIKVEGIPGATGVTELTKDTDFTIIGYTLNNEPADPINPGEYKVTIEGMGNYTGSMVIDYKINNVYNLKINGTQVKGANIVDVFNDGKVVFTPATDTEPNTLTLSGAEIGGTIESGLENLTIQINGVNSLEYITSTNNTAPLIFKKGTVNSSLSFSNTIGKPAVAGFASVAYNETYYKSFGSSKYVAGDVREFRSKYGGAQQDLTITTDVYYPLWVRDTQVSSANKNNVLNDENATVKFDGTNTLTLNGASISSSSAIDCNLKDLVIYLNGDNTLGTYYDGIYPILSLDGTGTLTIAKDDNATGFVSLSLQTTGNTAVISGFSSVVHTGLNFVSKTGTTLDGTTTYDATLSSATIYPLWVGGEIVTESVHSGSDWSYDAANNKLTLNNYSKTDNDGHAFISNMANLNVYLVGTNTVGPSSQISTDKAFYTTYTNATLTFSTDESAIGTLNASGFNTFCEGFRDVNGIYCNNGLGYYPGTREIKAKATPTISFNKRQQTGDNTPGDETGVFVGSETLTTTYGSTFYAPKPTFNNGYILNDSTRFEYSYSVDGVVEYPNNGEDANNPGKIRYGEISLLKAGTVTITCSFPGNMQNKPCSASYTLQVNKADAQVFEYEIDGQKITAANGYIDVDGTTSKWGTPQVSGSEPTLSKPDDVTSIITYGSSDNNVATVSETGAVTPKGPGTAIISATLKDDERYNDSTATYTLIVMAPATVSFANATASILNTETYTQAATTVPEGASITYSTNNTNGNVSVNGNGEVTISNSFCGTVTITATVTSVPDANPQCYYVLSNNAAFQASYTLTVSKIFNDVTFADGQNYATYYNGSEDMTLPEGLSAYLVTGTSGNSVVTSPVDYLPQNVPLLLEKSATAGSTLTNTTYSGTGLTDAEKNSNLLQYAEGNLPVANITGGTPYVLYKNEFVKATGTISEDHCYLLITNNAPTRGFYSIGDGNDGSTAIEGIELENEEVRDEWYDLQGRRIAKPTKAGLYIKNGKKMVINNK